jgi:hypothetical protein
MLASLVGDWLKLPVDPRTISALVDYVLTLDQSLISEPEVGSKKARERDGTVYSDDSNAAVMSGVRKLLQKILKDPNLEGPDLRNLIRAAVLSRTPVKQTGKRNPEPIKNETDGWVSDSVHRIKDSKSKGRGAVRATSDGEQDNLSEEEITDLRANGFQTPQGPGTGSGIIGYTSARVESFELPEDSWQEVMRRLHSVGDHRAARLLRAYLEKKLGEESSADQMYFRRRIDPNDPLSATLFTIVRDVAKSGRIRHYATGVRRTRHRRSKWPSRINPTAVREKPGFDTWEHVFEIGLTGECASDPALEAYGELQDGVVDFEEQARAAAVSREEAARRESEGHHEAFWG